LQPLSRPVNPAFAVSLGLAMQDRQSPAPSARLWPKPGNRLQLRFSRKADGLFDFWCLRQTDRPDIGAVTERFCFAEKGRK